MSGTMGDSTTKKVLVGVLTTILAAPAARYGGRLYREAGVHLGGETIEAPRSDTPDEQATTRFVEAFLNAVENHDVTELAHMVDERAMVLHALDRLRVPTDLPGRLVHSTVAGTRANVLEEITDSSAEIGFLGTHLVDGKPWVVFRVVSGGVVDHLRILLATGEKDEPAKIVDYEWLSRGISVQAWLRRFVVPFYAVSSDAVWHRLRGKPTPLEKHIARIGKAHNETDPVRVHEILEGLPEEINEVLEVLLTRMDAAEEAGDESARDRLIEELVRRFPEAEAAIYASIELHTERGELAEALWAIDRLAERTIDDPYFLVWKAELYEEFGRSADAVTAARQAIAREANVGVAPYWIVADASVTLGDFEEAARVLFALHETFGVDVRLEGVDHYEAFVASPEYERLATSVRGPGSREPSSFAGRASDDRRGP
jgi:hypothetical protein